MVGEAEEGIYPHDSGRTCAAKVDVDNLSDGLEICNSDLEEQ